jgi:FkbM family methyltransferase
MRTQGKLTPQEIYDLVGASPLLLEIGSHDGSDTVELLREMPDADIHCFEPEVRAIKRFRKRMNQGGWVRVTLYEVAVADVDGSRSFWASTGKAGKMEDWDYSGSLCKPTGHFQRSPEIDFKEPVEVPCIRLDSWYNVYRHTAPDHKRIVDFIWADVQGSQCLVVAGGWKTLDHTRYLYIESHNPPLYAGEPTQQDLIQLLDPLFTPMALYAQENILFKSKRLA